MVEVLKAWYTKTYMDGSSDKLIWAKVGDDIRAGGIRLICALRCRVQR